MISKAAPFLATSGNNTRTGKGMKGRSTLLLLVVQLLDHDQSWTLLSTLLRCMPEEDRSDGTC